MKVNVLIDGGFLEQALKKKKKRLSIVEIEAEVSNAIQKLKNKDGLSEAELFRVLYYDCYPFEGKAKDPQGTDIDFSTTPTVKFKKTLLNDISKHERYALRLGQLSFQGWKAHPQGNSTSPPTPIFQQKGVDMKCGLDIAVMSIKKSVDLILIIAGDSDFIAPLKTARKEGVLVAIYRMGLPVKDDLIRHCDFDL